MWEADITSPRRNSLRKGSPNLKKEKKGETKGDWREREKKKGRRGKRDIPQEGVNCIWGYASYGAASQGHLVLTHRFKKSTSQKRKNGGGGEKRRGV